MQIRYKLHNLCQVNFRLFIIIFLFIMQALSNIEYSAIQNEYYNEVHKSDSIDVWFSPEYYTTFESFNQGQIWY